MKQKNLIEDLFSHFVTPPREYSPAPFVFLNHDMSPEITGDVLRELSRNGIYSVVMHPRTGLRVQFGDATFWERLSSLIWRAGELGMQVWLYDDYNWPSGTAAGRVVRDHPEYIASGLVFKKYRNVHSTEDVLCVYGRDRSGLLRPTSHPTGKSMAVVARRMTDTTFALNAAPWFSEIGRGALDILNPDAVAYFMNIVYREFEENLCEFFGNPIIGVFTDEPQNYRPFPWTADLPRRFEEEYGYDLIPHLGSLIEDSGDFADIRHDYYRLVTLMGREAYYDKLRAWTRTHDLHLTGHLGEEDFLEKLPHTNGDLYAPLSRLSMPGTDYLGSGHGLKENEVLSGAPNVNPKMAASVARTMGRSRTTCEIWGGAGWGVGPRTLKESLDWAAALGINLFFPHAVHVSLMGLRKRDFPPSHFYQQPYWDEFHVFSDYISRVSLITSTGSRRGGILVLFPTRALWASTTYIGRLSPEGKELCRGIRDITDILVSHQYGFDYLFDEAIFEGKVTLSDGMAHLGDGRYSVLIIPPTPYLSDFVEVFINRAKMHGVRVILLGVVPEILKSHPKRSLIPRRIIRAKDVRALLPILKKTVRPDISIIGENSDKFVVQCRLYDKARIYFMTYLGDTPFFGELVLRGEGNLEIWDPERGERFGVNRFEVVERGVRLNAAFSPGESRIYVIHNSMTSAQVGWPSRLKNPVGRIFLSRRWEITPLQDNMFRIENWRIIKTSRPVRFPNIKTLWKDTIIPLPSKIIITAIRIAVEAISPFFGLRRKIRYRPFESMEKDFVMADLAERLLFLNLSKMSIYQRFDVIKEAVRYMGLPLVDSMPPEGAEYEIEANFFVGIIPPKTHLIWEDQKELMEIYVNGTLISDKSQEFFLWDRSNRRSDISRFLRHGKNRIGIKSKQVSFPTLPPTVHWIEPVVITGDFIVSGDVITSQDERPSGLTWGEEKSGNYSGTVNFHTTFIVSKHYAGKRAVLHMEDVRETVEITVNGESAGVRLWPPYSMDVTKFLKTGENSITLSVSNTAENLLGTPLISGILGHPRIDFHDM
ncbi:MAG: hypothetical protein JW885_00895 [Deltaproteobacteria bacterium]|nr:hypothetical protein [Candidatus Zymogenaceae bacterium]